LFSDNLLLWAGVRAATQQRNQTFKGLLFVSITGCIAVSNSHCVITSRSPGQQQEQIFTATASEERYDLAVAGLQRRRLGLGYLSGEAVFLRFRCKLKFWVIRPTSNMNQRETWLNASAT